MRRQVLAAICFAAGLVTCMNAFAQEAVTEVAEAVEEAAEISEEAVTEV